MAEPVKSILLVDFDSLDRSLAAAGGEGMDERLANGIDDWLGAIESGELLPADGGGTRAITKRRCYGSPLSADESRAAFVRTGFEVVQCDSQAQVEISMAIDAMDAAADAEGSLDFILLTAAPDLSPLVERLHARGHRVAIYVSEVTAPGYREAADTVISANALIAFLADRKAQREAAAARAAERNRIETFAREIHSATSIPMFSPKTFADLFRILADEVARNGYHFHDTAKMVAEQLSGSGRNVTSRQVVFVVKGLALKGHVFSTSDTAERLADVFREQARYLISNAGIALDEERETLLTAWITATPGAAAKPARPAAAAASAKSARPAQQPAAETRRPAPAAGKPARPAQSPPAAKPTPPRRAERPAAARPVVPPRPADRPRPGIVPPKPAPAHDPTGKPARPSDELRAAIAARIAASAKMRPSGRPPAASDQPAREPAASEKGGDTIESSILAAIAEAVDVLVEDGGKADARSTPREREPQPAAPRRRPPTERPPAAETAPQPAPNEEDEDSGDIGDEIQRIVSSYNRNRDDDRR